MPVLTSAPVLVASAVPGANEALALGQQARAAAWRAGKMRAELDRRLARPLPPAATIARRNAVQNRERYRNEYERAALESAERSAEWDALMEALREVAPLTADAVNAAVWGTEF